LQAKLDRLLALALGNTDAFVDAMPARRLIAPGCSAPSRR